MYIIMKTSHICFALESFVVVASIAYAGKKYKVYTRRHISKFRVTLPCKHDKCVPVCMLCVYGQRPPGLKAYGLRLTLLYSFTLCSFVMF